MKKLLLKIGVGVGKGLIKPLPLSSVVTAVKEAKESKWEMQTTLKLAVYILSGISLWALILGKITVADLLLILKALGI